MKEIYQLLGEKDLAIFLLQKQVKVLTDKLENIKTKLQVQENLENQ